MASNVLMFSHRVSEKPGWTNAELAELYRVEHALLQAQIAVETEYGVSDEGDPWFVFCRPGGEVVVHATRFDGLYRLFSPALPQPLTGPSFATLTRSFVSGLRAPVKTDERVTIHPAALLSVLIAAIFYSVDFHSGQARAAELAHRTEKQTDHITVVHSELVPAPTLFHTVVVTIEALLEPVAEGASHPFAFLAAVEAAAVAAVAVALSGLADIVTNSDVGSVLKTIAADVGLFGYQNGVIPSDQIKDKAQFDIAINLTKDSLAVDLSQASAQYTDETRHIQPAAGQQNAPSANGDKTAAAVSLAGVPVLSDNQALVVSASGDGNGATFITITDSSAIAAAPHSALSAVETHTGDSAIPLNVMLANADTLSFSGTANVQTVNIVLASGGGTIDLSGTAGINEIAVTGNGSLHISGITAAENPQLQFSSGSAESLSISFGAIVPTVFSIQLNGDDHLSVASISGNSANVQLTFDSEGLNANSVTIGDAAIGSGSAVAIRVIGAQDLTLNESAAVFNSTSVDASGLTGALTISLDLNNAFESVDLSQAGASNYVVANNANVAFLNTASGSHIQLGSDLNIVDFTIANIVADAHASLALDLQSQAAQPNPISIHLLDVFYTPTLALNSTGTGSFGINTIDMLTDSSLSTLTITGDSPLAISSIQGPTATDSQDININASTLTGSLSLNVSDIADTAALGRSITIIAGSGSSILTNMTASEATTFVIGSGNALINIGDGAVRDSIVALDANASVNVGSAAHNDVVINALSLGAVQNLVDGQGSLVTAAQVASLHANSSATDQAVLFSYQGSVYVFIDVAGSHVFDATHDAIIKLTGLTTNADLTNVFHSA